MLDTVSTAIHMTKAAPIRVEYFGSETTDVTRIHFNLSKPENLERFLRLITWASNNGVTLSIQPAY